MKRGGVENATKEWTGADAALICSLIGGLQYLEWRDEEDNDKKQIHLDYICAVF